MDYHTKVLLVLLAGLGFLNCFWLPAGYGDGSWLPIYFGWIVLALIGIFVFVLILEVLFSYRVIGILIALALVYLGFLAYFKYYLPDLTSFTQTNNLVAECNQRQSGFKLAFNFRRCKIAAAELNTRYSVFTESLVKLPATNELLSTMSTEDCSGDISTNGKCLAFQQYVSTVEKESWDMARVINNLRAIEATELEQKQAESAAAAQMMAQSKAESNAKLILESIRR